MIRVVVPLFLIIVLIVWFSYLRYLVHGISDKPPKESNERGVILRKSKFNRFFPLSFFIVWNILSLTIAFINLEDFWGILLAFSGIFGNIPFVVFIMQSLWKIEVRKDGFTYRNYFGITKSYSYDEVEVEVFYIRSKTTGKKLLRAPGIDENGRILSRAYTKYRQNANKQNKSQEL